MNRGGRPIDLVWQHFDKVEKDGKYYAKCRYCGNIRASRVDRMKSHVEQCMKQKQNLAEIPEIESLASTSTAVESKKLKIDSFVVKTSHDNVKKFDFLIAKFFYANNIPFNVIEHSTFQDLISALRPGYCPPSRKALAESLLDEVACEVEKKCKQNLEGKAVTLIEDGWSNIHNDSIISTCIHTDGKAYFLDALECGAVTKNANYHKQIVENAIHKAKDIYGCNVKAFVTDNAKVMEKTRQLLNETDPNLIVYGCSSHWLNLLGQTLTPESIVKHVIKIQKYFRNHHLPAERLKEFPESVKPQLPGDTRWNSQLICIDTFIKNRPLFQKIVEEHEQEIETQISQIINDYNLYKQCKDLLLQLKPIVTGLDMLQSDSASLSDACSVWLSLLNESSLQQHRDVIEKRMQQILKPFHFLAYLLNPKYMGEGLTNNQREIARTWATEKVTDCLPIIIAYEAQETPFPTSYFSANAKSINPVIWWKGISKCADFKSGPNAKFIELALFLLSCPASSAAIERVFSNFGLIHSKLRNRLGTEKCAKLVKCYRMLRGTHETDY